MKTKEQDVQAVKTLRHGEFCNIAWLEEGGGDVYRIWNTLFLFEIPQYGGEGHFIGAFTINEVEKLVDIAHSWT